MLINVGIDTRIDLKVVNGIDGLMVPSINLCWHFKILRMV
jgi:hypothetical protein